MSCQVLASWRVGAPEYWQPRSEEELSAATHDGRLALAQAGHWVPPPLPSTEEIDAETDAALSAWRNGDVPLKALPSGACWDERVPFLLHHRGRPLGELQVDLEGDKFTAFGEIDDEAAAEAEAEGMFCVSDHVFREARLRDHGHGLKVVEVTKWELLEVSATDTPFLAGTSLMVGPAGTRWVSGSTVERFARLASPDRVSLAFLAVVTVD